jgi:hypothetical protein
MVSKIWMLINQSMGLSLLVIGIWYEKPLISAGSIIFLSLSLPPSQIISRAIVLKYEFVFIAILIYLQTSADSLLNSLVLILYLMGLINGMLLPNPFGLSKFAFPLTLFLIFLLSLAFDRYDILSITLPGMSASAFGSNPDNYILDSRSLGYGLFILLLFLTHHFRGRKSFFHSIGMTAVAALSTNKFGMVYSVFFKLPRFFIFPIILILITAMGVIGYSKLSFTTTRANLWFNFFDNFPNCFDQYLFCRDIISLNNDEGVRSFHSILLDFAWYGGPVGVIAGIYFIFRLLTVRSTFGRSGALLFAVALFFGFPPFFNERHVLVAYAFFILFQEAKSRDISSGSLRARRNLHIK